MARPPRKDVDYFPFYVKNGRTLQLLEGKYECKGTGFFTNVLRFLSTRPDHHFSIADESDRLWFFIETKCDAESAIDMLNTMAITGKIHKELWDHQIIASQDYLESVEDAYRKRTNDIITIGQILDFYGITTGRNPHTAEFPAVETHKEEDNGRQSTDDNPQSKVKKSKVKIIKKFIPPPEKDVIAYFVEKGFCPYVATKAFDYYNVANWKDGRGNQVKNWKQKMIANWFKDEHKATTPKKPKTEAELRSELDRDK